MGTSSETATYVGGFSSTALSNKPDDNGVDGKRANGAAEIRQLKKILKDSFTNVTGAVTASHTELNYLDGVTGKSGSDTTLITGTAGTSGDLVVWDANGDAVDGPTPPSGTIVGTTDAQTLTNKTLTSPTINGGTLTGITDIAVANMTVDTTLNVRGAIDLADNDILRFGTGDDCQLFCDGSHMYMDLNAGIGNFYIRDGTTIRFTFDDAGDFTATGAVTAYSDQRLKEDVVTIPYALDTVLGLRGVSYTRKDTGERGVGVIAQEVETLVPEAVKTDEQGMKSVAYGNLVGLLIEAIKGLEARVAELEVGRS